MTASLMESVLERHPFFQGVSQQHVHWIAAHAAHISVPAGRMFFRQGEPANQFYLITKGIVALEVFAPTRGPIQLMTVGVGDVLGWSWLFPPYSWHLDARAVEEAEAIALDGLSLRAQCDADHELGYQLMKQSVLLIEQRLQAAMLQLIDMYGVKG